MNRISWFKLIVTRDFQEEWKLFRKFILDDVVILREAQEKGLVRDHMTSLALRKLIVAYNTPRKRRMLTQDVEIDKIENQEKSLSAN